MSRAGGEQEKVKAERGKKENRSKRRKKKETEREVESNRRK